MKSRSTSSWHSRSTVSAETRGLREWRALQHRRSVGAEPGRPASAVLRRRVDAPDLRGAGLPQLAADRRAVGCDRGPPGPRSPCPVPRLPMSRATPRSCRPRRRGVRLWRESGGRASHNGLPGWPTSASTRRRSNFRWSPTTSPTRVGSPTQPDGPRRSFSTAAGGVGLHTARAVLRRPYDDVPDGRRAGAGRPRVHAVRL